MTVPAGVAHAASRHVASSGALCALPLCMLYCNEATSVNCSEGRWLHRDDYYTVGSICTRLFFLLLLLLPIFFTPLPLNLLLATGAAQRGSWGTLQALFFPLRRISITIQFQTHISWVALQCRLTLLTSFAMSLISNFLKEHIYCE